jgi:hypothetical protein
MKRLVLIAALAVMSVISVGSVAASAAPPQQDSLAIPVVGSGTAGTFAGTFNLTRFVATSDGLAAIGTLTGTLTSPTGVVTTIVRNVTLPLAIGQATCDILHLDLGPLHLDVLGLVVDLNRIVLDITAQSGAGNLLGNLLCSVAGLLDNPSGLARLLNQILSILG